MFPSFDFAKDVLEITKTNDTQEIELGRVVMMNFDTGKARVITVNGIPVEAKTNKEKVEMYVQLLLRTDLDKYKIYKDTDFGMTYFRYIGNSTLPIGFINSELKREIEEKITALTVVDSITNFSASRSETYLNVSFQINLTDGEVVTISEVI